MNTSTRIATPELRFRRNEFGYYDARFAVERDVLFTTGEVMCTTVDSVTFRLCKDRAEVGGWRLLVFASGTVIYDDDDVDTLKFGKLYAARLADVPRLQEIAMEAMADWKAMHGNTPRTVTRSVRHEPFMLALDDFYGPADRDR